MNSQWYPLDDAQIIYWPQIAICLVLGLYAMWVVTKDQTRWWPLLLGLTVATPGFMIHRFDLVDSFFAAVLLCAALARLVVGAARVQHETRDALQRLHGLLFTVMALYFVGQAARGLVELDSLRKIRWVVFYSMLALFPVALRRAPAASLARMTFAISAAGAAFFGIYIAYGFLSEQVRGIGRFALQTAEFGSTAQVMFPVVLAMPAAIVLVSSRGRSRARARVGWLAIATAAAAAVVYDSRSAQLAIAAFTVVGARSLGVRRLAMTALLLAAVFTASLRFAWAEEGWRDVSYLFTDVFQSTFGSAVALIDPDARGARDTDRVVYVRAGFEAITGSWSTLLFGYGFRTHTSIVGPYVADLLRFYGSSRTDIGTDPYNVGVEGFTAFTIDTGIVGLLLLLANAGVVALTILRRGKNRYRYLWLLSLGAACGWTLVINIVHVVLFYLMLMPNGPILRLSEAPEDERPAVSAAVRARVRRPGCRGARPAPAHPG